MDGVAGSEPTLPQFSRGKRGDSLSPGVVSPYRRGRDSDVTDHHQRALPGTPPRGAGRDTCWREEQGVGVGGARRASPEGLTGTVALDGRPEPRGPGASATTLQPLPSGRERRGCAGTRTCAPHPPPGLSPRAGRSRPVLT